MLTKYKTVFFRVKLLIVALLFSVLQSGCAITPSTHKEDSWFTQDKVAHFALSSVISAGLAKAAKDDGQSNCDAALIGFGITMSLGAAKESYDKRVKGTLYSFHDMTWNFAGSLIGSMAGANCH